MAWSGIVGAAAAATADSAGRRQACLPPVCIVPCLLPCIAQDLMSGLNGLEARDVFLLFAGVPVGMIQQSELAVLLLDIVQGAVGGELEVGIVVMLYVGLDHVEGG